MNTPRHGLWPGALKTHAEQMREEQRSPAPTRRALEAVQVRCAAPSTVHWRHRR